MRARTVAGLSQRFDLNQSRLIGASLVQLSGRLGGRCALTLHRGHGQAEWQAEHSRHQHNGVSPQQPEERNISQIVAWSTATAAPQHTIPLVDQVITAMGAGHGIRASDPPCSAVLIRTVQNERNSKLGRTEAAGSGWVGQDEAAPLPLRPAAPG